MATLPDSVTQAWENKSGPVVLTTVDGQGNPNSIYASCVRRYGEDRIVVADNYFNKTRSNILAGGKGAILFITGEGQSFQVKGTMSYERSGDIYEDMKKWNGPKHPGHAAAVLVVEEVYKGADKIL